MEVVFIHDVPNQAHAGQVKRVSDGYARNYLIPKGLAAMATPEVLKRVRKIAAAGDERRVQETQVMQELAQFLDKANITLAARVTPAGRYYGAITASRIAEQLSVTLGRPIERRLVENMDPIREPGEYDVVLRLSGDITATIHVKAETEE
ncbi:MAG TPA: 50S ribosomal protein L9 [Dehalococcoidia bacterium]|nr:50S ribosomal protein L9 [Dehalococcoidia bacterium]